MASCNKDMANHLDQRRHLDLLFLLDAAVSLLFGTVALLTPHGLLVKLVDGGELYGCLRIAMGWITFNIRSVDDGRFRRSVCESLCLCYLLQALAVLRAQFTDRKNTINWIAIVLLSAIGSSYGTFRFGRGGNMIKVYELPQNDKTIR
ncbi:hypothetical protein ACHAXA_009430 [Cyclostephanos tholiformis]|uniref:Uncharacterized protein n=1 Tax=Cyclostephanos tholiformis TaxID=382380 RepID=A0ABD3RG02_9STRA